MLSTSLLSALKYHARRVSVAASPLWYVSGCESSTNTADGERKKIMIVGCNGNMGSKLTQHWLNTHQLFLVDKGKPTALINQCLMQSQLTHHHIQLDLVKDCHDCTESALSRLIAQSDVIIHLAANNPFPDATWPQSIDTTDMINHVFMSCTHPQNMANHKKTRIVFASSNHCMGGYLQEGGTLSRALDNGYRDTALLDVEKVPLNPGTKIKLENGYTMDSTPYATAKVFGERLAGSLCSLYPRNMEAVVLRIGWNQFGENLPSTLSATGSHSDVAEDDSKRINERVGFGQEKSVEYDDVDDCENWFRHMWLSNVDLLQLFDCAVNHVFDEKMERKYTVCNGVSANSNSRWSTQNDIGYQPISDVNVCVC